MTRDGAVHDLITGASDRAGLIRLLSSLGFEADEVVVPRRAWAAHGLDDDAGVSALVVAGRAGTLEALLLELEGEATAERVVRCARGIRARNTARLHLLAFAQADYRLAVLGTFGLDGTFRHLLLEPDRPRASDVEALAEMAPRNGERGLELAIRHMRALDRSRVTRRFFRDFRARRASVAAAWSGLPAEATRERDQLALLFLCRLTFLYFLQRRGALAGDDRYLPALLGAWSFAERGGVVVPEDDRAALGLQSVSERDEARTDPGPNSKSKSKSRSISPSFYHARLVSLFFGALNRHPADRDAAALSLGDLPYLNGGLFEPHALELRFAGLDLPDREVRGAIEDLLERYRFSSREAGEGAGFGIDPEMLGRVFEGLMAPADRGDTGSFYTPAPVVKRVVREAVAAYVTGSCGRAVGAAVAGAAPLSHADRMVVRRRLERIRILDPACGSGAFLLGALHRLARTLGAVSDREPADIRRDLVARSLHGVDLLDDAALLCSLRLWLALSEHDGVVRPLPNLDRRIRQGDALVDPLDLADLEDEFGDGAPAFHPLRDPTVRRALRAVPPAAARYLDSAPEQRGELRADLGRAEAELARHWIDGVRRAQHERIRRLRARAGDRDLFGGVPEEARRARALAERAEQREAEMSRLARELDEKGALPFFSFGIHFAEAREGFDVVLSNPPWVRSHRWPERLRRLAARSYEVCRTAGWRAGAELAGAPQGVGAQVDLSLLFLERSIRLLAPGGVLALLLPAKTMRALYGDGARRIALRDLDFALIEDHALDQRSIFKADAFASIWIARRRVSGRPTVSPETDVDVGDVGDMGDVGKPADVGEPWVTPTSPMSPASPANPAAARAPEIGVGQPGGRLDPGDATGNGLVRVRMFRRGVAPLEFTLPQRSLSLFEGDSASPWVIAPPDVTAALRTMQAAGPPLGRHPGLRVRRGIMTGANDVLVLRRVEPKLGGIARVEAEGHEAERRKGRSARAAGRFRAHLETAAVRPLVRGADIDAFSYRTESYVLWSHDAAGRPVEPPMRAGRYLARHREALEARPGWRAGLPLGTVFRLARETLGHKVAWHDLSDTLRAVALPATVKFDGVARELVPLNTVYFLPTPDRDAAVLLAGLLNSLPVRTFARAIAERAKDARFRFFAWTVSCLPLPAGWPSGAAASELGRLAAEAHESGGITPAGQAALDRVAARLYGLGEAQLEALAGFDRWLRGES